MTGSFIDVGNDEPKREIKEASKNISNDGILDNADFQIWQRALTFTGTSLFCADRWFFGCSKSITVLQDTNGIKLGAIPSFVDGDYTILLQRIRRNNYFNRYVLNKKVAYTLSINGIVYSGVFTFDAGSGGKNIKSDADSSVRIEWNGLVTANYGQVAIVFRESTEHIVNYFKLEIGETPTKFVPKTEYEELAICLRYFQKINVRTIVNSFVYDANTISANTSMLLMAEIPTAVIVGEPTLSNGIGGYLSGFTYLCTPITNMSYKIVATKTAHGLTGGTSINFGTGSWVELTAEPT